MEAVEDVSCFTNASLQPIERSRVDVLVPSDARLSPGAKKSENAVMIAEYDFSLENEVVKFEIWMPLEVQ